MWLLIKIFIKIVAAFLILVLVVVALDTALVRWQFRLPSDDYAKRVFAERKSDLDNLVAMVDRNYEIESVDSRGIAYGEAARDPAHIACAELLKNMGAKHLTHTQRGVVEIYFWGSGCAICHDSYKGFAYVRDPAFDMPPDSKLCQSLDDRVLPRGKYAPVEDGTYLVPITDHWYLIRSENG